MTNPLQSDHYLSGSRQGDIEPELHLSSLSPAPIQPGSTGEGRGGKRSSDVIFSFNSAEASIQVQVEVVTQFPSDVSTEQAMLVLAEEKLGSDLVSFPTYIPLRSSDTPSHCEVHIVF